MNPSKKAEQGAFILRFWQYLLERFPPLGNGLLIVVFSFSAIAYSILLRGANEYITAANFLIAVFLTVGLFLLLRISDEFKDAEEDFMHRRQLPVPRGLISLRELAGAAVVIFISQLFIVFAFAPEIFPLYALAIAYMAAMFFEFGIGRWLKQHQWAYNASHIVIIPLVDIVASAFDWKLKGLSPPIGLAFFFAVSYCNGIVLELGRKLGAPGQEDLGKRLYTTRLGQHKAGIYYALALVFTYALAIAAALAAGHSWPTLLAFTLLLVVAFVPVALHFWMGKASAKTSKSLEITSGLWTLGMYLLLGGIPMLGKLLGI